MTWVCARVTPKAWRIGEGEALFRHSSRSANLLSV